MTPIEDASECFDGREQAIAGWAWGEGWRRGFTLGVILTAGMALAMVWVLR